MADSPEEQPDFETCKEDGPEVDVESGIEAGSEAIQRAETTILSSINQRPNPQPVVLSIPNSLYDKAQNQQNELTQEERDLLLSRSDLVGKALAQPDSLTINERHQALFWPPPDEVRANIQRVTGGRLSTPHELYAKVKDAMVRGQFDEEEIALVGRNFYADIATFCSRANLAELLKPGKSQAAELLRSQPSIALSGLSGVPARFELPPSTPLALTDIQPGRPWPSTSQKRTPLDLFMETTKLRGFEVHPGWYALPEDQKEAYRTRIETLRLEDWAEYRTATAEGRSLLPHGSRHLIYEGPRSRPLPKDAAAAPSTHGYIGPESVYITGLQLLHGDLGTGVEFQEVLSRWHALSQEQLETYEARAATARTAVQDAEMGYTSGIKVFNGELGVGIELQEVLRRWDTLTKEQKGAYEEKAMRARHTAKSARYQKERNDGARYSGIHTRTHTLGERGPESDHITGMGLFNDELGIGPDPLIVSKRWYGLTEAQRETYDTAAATARVAALSAWEQERSGGGGVSGSIGDLETRFHGNSRERRFHGHRALAKELGPGIRYSELNKRWAALTEEQREAYVEKAKAARAAVRAALEQERSA